MAKVIIEHPSHPESDPVPMVYITIEGPRYGKANDASLSFETKRGFGFRILRADAHRLVRKLTTYLQRTAPSIRRGTAKATGCVRRPTKRVRRPTKRVR
jgi:hypothetical protein